jgi:hypothetical protein
MRQLWTGPSHLRWSSVVAATFVITLAASSPIYSKVGGSQIAGHAFASPLVAEADCSMATARRLVAQHRLNTFLLPNSVHQVLCGPFTGSGSEAMAVTLTAPTCWSPQGWAVFRFTEGDWQLVMVQRLVFIVSPLVAVGADLRETRPVFRQGDPRCIPSGGSRARTWHWDGTRFAAGPWKQVTPGIALRNAAFYSPSKNISCGMLDDGRSNHVTCQSLRLPQKVTLYANGRLRICRGSEARCRLGNAGNDVPTLGYGRQITVGRFRCRSQRAGVRCVVIRSGRGFLISRQAVVRV